MGVLFEKVNEVIDSKVRNGLKDHGGDIELLSVEDNVVRVKFLGACRGCPGAQMTIEDIVEANIVEEIPEIEKVTLVNDVDEDMMAMARKILNKKK